MSTRALLATEWLKLRTVRAPWLLAAAAVAITLVLAVQPVLQAGRGGPSIGTAGALLGVLGATGRGPLVALAFGALLVTGEYRHATLTATLLATPDRARLLGAKALTALLGGLVLGALSVLTALAVATAAGAVRADLVHADVLARVAGLLLAHPLYGLLGLGAGALLARFPATAVLLPLAWLLFLEGLVVGGMGRHLLPWSLGGATAALANAGDLPGVLPIWAGALLLTGFAAVLAVAGTARLTRSDIT
jgi:ABC-2 type transport system permease protein